MLAKTTDRLEGTKEVMSTVLRGVNKALTAVGIESSTIQSLGGAPNVDPLGETYYSVTPFRYGDHIAKFSRRPRVRGFEEPRRQGDRRVGPSGCDPRDGAGGDEGHRCRLGPARPAVPRSRETACRGPDRRVEGGRHAVPEGRDDHGRRTDSWDEGRVQAVDEEMRFSIWTGLAAHQPLGNINRARRDTYRHSAEFRERFNRCPIHEPGAV